MVNINLPPLRERGGDVPLLANHFFKEFAAANGKDIADISQETLNILSAYAWPGNIRELRNTIEKMVVLARTNRLTPRDVPAHIRAAVEKEGATGRWRGAISPVLQGETLDDAERMMIYAALQQNKGNKSKAARQLGISRRTLHRKLDGYGEKGE